MNPSELTHLSSTSELLGFVWGIEQSMGQSCASYSFEGTWFTSFFAHLAATRVYKFRVFSRMTGFFSGLGPVRVIGIINVAGDRG